MRDPLQGVRPLVIAATSGAIGAVLAWSLLPGVAWSSLWRLVVLPIALTLVVAGLVSLVRLGLLERRHARPARSHYLRAAGALVVAFGLVIAAAS